MDRTGYFEAEVNGRIGLVPANYLQPIHHISNYHSHSDPWLFPSYDQRPEQTTETFRHFYPEPAAAVKGVFVGSHQLDSSDRRWLQVVFYIVA